MGLMEFLSLPGQERTRRRDEFLGGLLNYYLGPTGIPERLGVADLLNPVSDVGRAMTSSQEVLAPGRTPMERVGAGATMLADMASVAAPAAATRIAGGDATQGMVEGLLGIGAPTRQGLDDAARRFAADESGALTLWHGSPHDFDRFSMDKIGTGEGAQAYGHGLYFAEARPVAEGYRDALSGTTGIANATSSTAAQGSIADRLANAFGGDGQSFMRGDRSIVDYARRFATEAEAGDEGETIYRFSDGSSFVDFGAYWDVTSLPVNRGRLYEVSVDANPEDFLDWDAPLSAQPAAVQDAFAGMGRDYEALGDTRFIGVNPDRIQYDAATYPSGIIKNAGDRGQVEAELRARGIPGIRYLDAGSRGAGDGSRNYVVFDENLISIIRKYGIAGAAAMLGMSQADLAQAMEQQQPQPQGLLGGPQ